MGLVADSARDTDLGRCLRGGANTAPRGNRGSVFEDLTAARSNPTMCWWCSSGSWRPGVRPDATVDTGVGRFSSREARFEHGFVVGRHGPARSPEAVLRIRDNEVSGGVVGTTFVQSIAASWFVGGR